MPETALNLERHLERYIKEMGTGEKGNEKHETPLMKESLGEKL